MMRRFALLVAASVSVGWGLAATIGGCGGDDGAVTVPSDNDATASSSSGTSGATSTSGASGTSGSSSGTSGTSGTSDGGDASSSTSSGTVSNPGKITCGASECDGGGSNGGTSVCCVHDAGTATPVCTTNALCGDGDLELRCDETLDCPTITTQGGNQVQQKCCFTFGGGGRRTECQFPNFCNVQICKTDAECGDGGANQATCSTKKCGLNGQYTLRVCGTPQGCQ